MADRPRGLGEDPLSADELLDQSFFREERDAPKKKAKAKPEAKKKPTHYKVVSISLYTEDIERLEALVEELKRRGHRRANKSQLIRFALDTVDIDDLPRGY
ncbi:MAG: hypothetical protein RIT81_32925 [Deltaproteobacteria bacterium]